MNIEDYKKEIKRMVKEIHDIKQIEWIYNIVCISYEKAMK